MTLDQIRTLEERAAWLEARIAAKKSVGWETQYDERECDALKAAIPVIRNAQPENFHCG